MSSPVTEQGVFVGSIIRRECWCKSAAKHPVYSSVFSSFLQFTHTAVHAYKFCFRKTAQRSADELTGGGQSFSLPVLASSLVGVRAPPSFLSGWWLWDTFICTPMSSRRNGRPLACGCRPPPETPLKSRQTPEASIRWAMSYLRAYRHPSTRFTGVAHCLEVEHPTAVILVVNEDSPVAPSPRSKTSEWQSSSTTPEDGGATDGGRHYEPQSEERRFAGPRLTKKHKEEAAVVLWVISYYPASTWKGTCVRQDGLKCKNIEL
ncbi:hypothetical protein BJ322DRAFT_1020699 [Thelephora terrestris]|uniref:Uncharacterized protein n=1 Tax=Thelephora terrestris TaxID=56493 RepID=A0A9P6HEJ1_9AGAM|nr:hypothetical protein BJ322DRAFT_1020699 [Thelephora terrestris]